MEGEETLRDKASLRTHLQAWRSGLTSAQVRAWSAALQGHLLDWPPLAAPRVVLLYTALRREPQTAGLAVALHGRGAAIAVPTVVGPALEPRLVLHPERGLLGDAELGPVVAPRDVDVALIPGLAFDCTGGRLGRGGGHYDRFLPLLRPECRRVGLCFAGQIVPAVPLEAWDQTVDAVVTETGVWEGVDRRAGRA